jgi:hypothetical protein
MKNGDFNVGVPTSAAAGEDWQTFLQSIYVLFNPSRLLDGYPWRAIWEARERRLVIVTSQAWFILATLAYAAHYYLFDRNQQLQPPAILVVLPRGYGLRIVGYGTAVCVTVD